MKNSKRILSKRKHVTKSKGYKKTREEKINDRALDVIETFSIYNKLDKKTAEMNKKIAPIKEQGIKIAIHNAQEIIDLLNIYYTKFN